MKSSVVDILSVARDNANGRILGNELPDNSNVTVEDCIASCSASNFTLAGLEFSVQCCKALIVLFTFNSLDPVSL